MKASQTNQDVLRRIPRRLRGTAGYSMIEALVFMGVLGIALTTATTRVNPTRMNAGKAQRIVISSLRLARSNAITKNVHYAVEFPTTSKLKLERMKLSSGVWVIDTTQVQTIQLPPSTHFASATVGSRVEFSTRGLAINLTGVVSIDVTDKFNVTKSTQAWPSGQVNEL